MGSRWGTAGLELERRVDGADRVDIDRMGGAGQAAPSALCWPGFAFDRMQVRDLRVPAYCVTPSGELWEYEDDAFFVTGRGRRRRVDETDAPFDGWSHPGDCACAACRVARR
jgi:hypothetical protein